MDVIESKGKTVDEAVFSGLLKMDLSIDEVDIEILDEGGGLFKSARVRMTKKKDSELPGKIEMAGEKQEAPPAKRETPRYEARRDDKKGRPHRREYDQRHERKAEEAELVTPKEPQNDAEKFLYGLFERMGVNVTLKSEKLQDDILRIDMSGKAMGMLIGRRGETLDALQYLTSLVTNNGKEEYLKVMLDTENYRKKREEALKRLALRLADKVVKSGKKVVLEPMNPYERRILHATLQDHPGITTYSEGEDPFRSVVVALKDETKAEVE
ncbi:MAG: RNA-binding cell elongation regulator Jag/EloR [Burkholderiales bacterium]